MTYQPALYHRVSTDPRVQVHPAFQFARFEFTLAALAIRRIQVQQLDPFPAAYQNWLLGSWNVLNFLITKDQFGGILRVDESLDGTNYDQQHCFALDGQGFFNSCSGFELSGFSAQFVIQNDGVGPSIIKGWIQVRSF